MLQPGDRIDIWVVEKALGTGGMGSVYRCHNKAATRILAAIKTLDPAVRSTSGAEERFIREAEILYQLDHPNIVKVRNVRIDADVPYIEMEFVEGKSIDQKLRNGALPYDECLAVIEQLADALAYMHARGVCHRDIKPANVLFDKQGRVRLVDFGLALESDRSRLTQQGMTFGTVSYAPPEWVTPDQLDPMMWDLYATGVVFWEMLTGRVAFAVSGQGSLRQQAMQVILAKQDHPPLDPGTRFPEDVRRLVGEMTHSDPAERVQSLAEVVERLRSMDRTLPETRGTTATPVAPARVDSPATWTSESPTAPPPAGAPRVDASADTWLNRRPGGWWLPLALGGVVGVAAVAAITVGVVLATTQPIRTEEPVDRVVRLRASLPEGAPARLVIDGEAVVPDASGVVAVTVPTPGELVVGWVVGEPCPPTDCPGRECPEWCGADVQIVEVAPGVEPLDADVVVPPPPRHPVPLALPPLPDGLAPSVWLDGEPAPLPLEASPGRHALRVDVGVCPAEAAGCGDACPEGCASFAAEVVVPWTAAPEPVAVTLAAVASAPATLPSPATAPAPVRGGRFVTHAQFAAWLASHPEYQRQAAIDARRADAGYLSGWEADQPPASQAGAPVVRVSWHAASAYCAGRGGLPPIDAALPRASSDPPLELRARGGSPALLDAEAGEIPIDPKTTNVMTGFRCAR